MIAERPVSKPAVSVSTLADALHNHLQTCPACRLCFIGQALLEGVTNRKKLRVHWTRKGRRPLE